jgi:hypothetical protein
MTESCRKTQGMETSMRTFVVALVIFGMFATAVQAADDKAADDTSAVVGQFPDTVSNLHVYLFKLLKNNISLSMSPQEFCSKMDYGKAVLSEETGKDNKAGPGKLDWVICRFKAK